MVRGLEVSSVPTATQGPVYLILIVVVLYGSGRDGSKTLRGLADALRGKPTLLEGMRVLLWDNSPEQLPAHALEQLELSFPFTYRHSVDNVGVAGAYNAAAAMAIEEVIPWLLLLDQDTAVTEVFLAGMAQHARAMLGNTDVSAAVPFLMSGETQLSPRLVRFGRHTPFPSPQDGPVVLTRQPVFAANSGTLMRVAALTEIGGYSDGFWLDFSDIYVFHQLHRAGKSILLASDLRLEHEIAMQDYDRQMTVARYRNYLAAEGAFHDLYKGWLERAAYPVLLLLRSVRQRRFRNPAFRQLTQETLWRRLRTPRWRRISAWHEARSARLPVRG